MGRPYAEVIGDPIAHSKSPLIHNFWLGKLGIDAEYRACHVRPGELADYFTRRRGDAEWRGCNVTMPHKRAAMHEMYDMDRHAEAAGAVNTVTPESERTLTGTNTDIAGVLSALPENLLPRGAEVCILGSGGAARAALAACSDRDVAIVLLSVRNEQAGWSLLEEFGFGGTVGPIDDAHNIKTAEVIINATPMGMVGAPPMPNRVLDHLREPLPDAVALDMVYNPLETAFLTAARDGGCHTVDGLAMLIGQAAAAFEKFFSQPAPRQHDAELRALLTA